MENGIVKCMNFTDSQNSVPYMVSGEKKIHNKVTILKNIYPLCIFISTFQ